MQRKEKVSQKQIAQAAQVSQATVSLVLAGQRVGSEQTRARVLDAAERLKYRPNLLVRGMQTGRTKSIGVLVPPYDDYWSEILYGIHDTLANSDYLPITLWSAHDRSGIWRREAKEPNVLAQVHRLLDRRIDGVILWPPFAIAYVEYVAEFSGRNLPVVTIDHELDPRFPADSVCSDEALGGSLVAEHLLSLGHRRLGHLAGPPIATWAVRRRQAFEAAVLQQCPSATVVTCVAPETGPQGHADTAHELLRRRDRPTAIFAASDLYAKWVYQACHALKLRIPQDVSVVGFSDDDFAREMDPPLTTIRQSSYEIGCRAADRILRRCEGEQEQFPHKVRLGLSLIARCSTQAIGSSDHSSSIE